MTPLQVTGCFNPIVNLKHIQNSEQSVENCGLLGEHEWWKGMYTIPWNPQVKQVVT